MRSSARYMATTGEPLPAEFCPPERAAERIAALNTIAEREALWLRIPEPWRKFIGDFVPMAIASRIVEMPTKLERQNALASVPDMWRDHVRGLVVSLWQTKTIREEYQAELAARRREKAAA